MTEPTVDATTSPATAPDESYVDQAHDVENEVTTDGSSLLHEAESDVVKIERSVVDKLHADLKKAVTMFTGNRAQFFQDLVDLLEPHASTPAAEPADSTPTPTGSTVQTG